MKQYVGAPITFPYPPEAANDPAVVSECQEIVKSKVYELIDRGLREREAPTVLEESTERDASGAAHLDQRELGHVAIGDRAFDDRHAP